MRQSNEILHLQNHGTRKEKNLPLQVSCLGVTIGHIKSLPTLQAHQNQSIPMQGNQQTNFVKLSNVLTRLLNQILNLQMHGSQKEIFTLVILGMKVMPSNVLTRRLRWILNTSRHGTGKQKLLLDYANIKKLSIVVTRQLHCCQKMLKRGILTTIIITFHPDGTKKQMHFLSQANIKKLSSAMMRHQKWVQIVVQ